LQKIHSLANGGMTLNPAHRFPEGIAIISNIGKGAHGTPYSGKSVHNRGSIVFNGIASLPVLRTGFTIACLLINRFMIADINQDNFRLADLKFQGNAVRQINRNRM